MSEYLEMPPLIDVHVHCRTPGQEEKEDFTTAAQAALAGGVITILDMPNNKKLIDSLERLEEKKEMARKTAVCDMGFYLGTLGDPDQNFAEAEPEVFGVKIYLGETTGGFIIRDPYKLEQYVFRPWDFAKPILAHVEGDTLATALLLAEKYDRQIHICHVSLASEVDQIRRAKMKRGDKITAEVTPHHLCLSKLRSPHPYGQMKPPLSAFSDMHVLWEAVRDGTIDIIATDHAPHTKAEKLGNQPPSGVTGLETMLPLLLMAERAGEISLERIKEMTHYNPMRIFNIPEQPNSYVLVDQDVDWKIQGEKLQTKPHLTPFEGETMMDQVKEVVLRGETVYLHSDYPSLSILAQPGSGKVLPFSA